MDLFDTPDTPETPEIPETPDTPDPEMQLPDADAVPIDEAGDDPQAREAMGAVVAATAAKRVCIRVRPERVVSWDHRKRGGVY